MLCVKDASTIYACYGMFVCVTPASPKLGSRSDISLSCYVDCHGELRVCSAIKKVYYGLEGASCGCVVGRTRESAAIPMVDAVIMAWNLQCRVLHVSTILAKNCQHGGDEVLCGIEMCKLPWVCRITQGCPKSVNAYNTRFIDAMPTMYQLNVHPIFRREL